MKFLILLLLSASAISGSSRSSGPGPVKVDDYISVRSSLAWMIKLGDLQDCIMNSQGFREEIKNTQVWTYTTDSSEKILETYLKKNGYVISTYYKRFGSVIATTTGVETYFNLKFNPRPESEMLNTACHERAHTLGYSHGDNFPNGKQDSVPYKIGAYCEKWAKLSECVK